MLIRTLCLLIAILGSTCLAMDIRLEGPAGKPEIFIIGSVHSMHYNPDYHYSITDLLEQIRSLEPDVVCGEIAPEAFEQVTDDYYQKILNSRRIQELEQAYQKES